MMRGLKVAIVGALLSIAGAASAAEFRIGGHVGAVGSTNSQIGYGINANINPYGWVSLELDATLAHFASGTYFGTSPAVIFYLTQYEEFRLGVGGGAGFHRFGGAASTTNFALNLNAQGEFNLTPNVLVGLMTRHNFIFNSDDLWSVFLTFGFRFEPGGGW